MGSPIQEIDFQNRFEWPDMTPKPIDKAATVFVHLFQDYRAGIVTLAAFPGDLQLPFEHLLAHSAI